MAFTLINNEFHLPIIQSTTKIGKDKFWQIYVVGDKIYKKHWYKDGKVTTSKPTVAKPKNIGKSNETTGHQQALSEALSQWTKKAAKSTKPPVILAKKYDDKTKRHLGDVFAVSPKMDGIRCIAHKKNNQVILYSREGNIFTFLDHIKEQLDLCMANGQIFDGELYNHNSLNYPFEFISGIVRSKNQRHPNEEIVHYYIFDVIWDNQIMNSRGYQDRMVELKQIETVYEDDIGISSADGDGDVSPIYFVYYETINHDQLKDKHDEYVEKGYEGVVCRRLDSVYENSRSKYFLKYKEFYDEEYIIYGYGEGRGNAAGTIVFECITCTDCNHNSTNSINPTYSISNVQGNPKNSQEIQKKVINKCPKCQTFGAKYKGTMERQREMLLNGNELIGKLLTVRYQKKINNIPVIYTGVAIRDYE